VFESHGKKNFSRRYLSITSLASKVDFLSSTEAETFLGTATPPSVLTGLNSACTEVMGAAHLKHMRV